jgi:hypothetical protein
MNQTELKLKIGIEDLVKHTEFISLSAWSIKNGLGCNNVQQFLFSKLATYRLFLATVGSAESEKGYKGGEKTQQTSVEQPTSSTKQSSSWSKSPPSLCSLSPSL